MWLQSVRAALIGKRSSTRILCHFNHYYGTASALRGRSTAGDAERRGAVVRSAFGKLRAVPFDIDVRVCGLPGSSLLPSAAALDTIGVDPQHIVYASIECVFGSVSSYDYFLNIEDDVLISEAVINACVLVCQTSVLNEVYLPNHIEIGGDGTSDCVDLAAHPGWQPALRQQFHGTILGVANNPHTGLSFLSRDQMHYAAERIDLPSREVIVGGMMASAYANLHAPFLLWRAHSDVMAHHVVHLDRWMHRTPAGQPSPADAAPADAAPTANGAAPCAMAVGCLDAVVLEAANLKIAGWAMSESGCPATELQLHAGEHPLAPHPAQGLTRVDRPDVRQVHPQAEMDCGFESTVPTSPLFAIRESTVTPRLRFGFRSRPEVVFSFLPEAALVNAIADIDAAVGALPDMPFMPSAVTEHPLDLMRRSKCYLECGTGGTTLRGRAIGIPTIVAVESDPLWLEGVRAKTSRVQSETDIHFIHADIGPTGPWGHPTSEARLSSYGRYPISGWQSCRQRSLSPDLVLVDGRFRVACVLASLMFWTPGCRILVDDYFDRPGYAVINRFVEMERKVDPAAEFVVPDEPPHKHVRCALIAAVTDPS